MKTTLTIEQSAELIKRGVSPDKELVNALYTTLLWAIGHNHVKLD